MKERMMKRLITAALAIAALAAVSCGAPPYTARVTDAETGEPVEGAVYLAVWWDEVSGKKAWFEGTSTEMTKFVEGTTGEDGLIKVPDFWTRNPFAKERTLTVYKPGWVMWNQEYVFPDMEKRSGFGIEDRDVRLKRWKLEYSYKGHERLLINAGRGQITGERYREGKQVFINAYRSYEEDRFRSERRNRKGKIK